MVMAQSILHTRLSKEHNGSPLLGLATEILHMICLHFEVQDVARIRLVCKRLESIGIHHLVHEVNVVFKSSSFERMRQMSRHPILSQTVKSIFYEADILRQFDSFEAWETYLLHPFVKDGLSATYPGTEMMRGDLKGLLDITEMRRNGSAHVEARAGYARYQKYLADQETIIRDDYGSGMIHHAFSQFPNLTKVSLIREGSLLVCTKYLVKEFSAGLQIPYMDHIGHDEHGIAQLRSLLVAAVSTNRKLESLTCDQVHWSFFRQSDKEFAKVRPALSHLKSLDFKISICSREFDDPHHPDGPHCANLLSCTNEFHRGVLCRFISAAPHLRSLAITANAYGLHQPFFVWNVVGTNHWPYLERAEFSFLMTSEEDLLGFCTRHAQSLTHLTLYDIVLITGTWERVLQQIRKILHLQSVEIAGFLTDMHSPGHDLNPICFEDPPPQFWLEKSRLRIAVEEYLLEGGDADPLDLDPGVYYPGEDFSRDPRTNEYALYGQELIKRMRRAKLELSDQEVFVKRPDKQEHFRPDIENLINH